MLVAPLDPRAKVQPTDAEVEAEGAAFMALMAGGEGVKVGG